MPDRDSVELETEVREEESDWDGDGQKIMILKIFPSSLIKY